MGENLKDVWAKFAIAILPNISSQRERERERERANLYCQAWQDNLTLVSLNKFEFLKTTEMLKQEKFFKMTLFLLPLIGLCLY
jgi:hypothetical protein